MEELPKEVLKPIEKHVQFQPSPSVTEEIAELKSMMENIERKLDGMIQQFSAKSLPPTQEISTITPLLYPNPVNILKQMILEEV
jgi:hypothetical protein